MARYDGHLKAVGEAAPSEVFGTSLFETTDQSQRQEAIACYLSGSDGWQEAIKLLCGAFAPEQRESGSELTGGKAD